MLYNRLVAAITANYALNNFGSQKILRNAGIEYDSYIIVKLAILDEVN